MTTPPQPPAEPPAPATPPDGTSGADTLTERVGTLEAKVDQVLDALHTRAAGHTAARLDRGSEIEDIARREIERGQAAQAEREAAEQAAGRVTALETTVAKLTETPPAPPVRRIERLFWPGGRTKP